MKKGNKTSLDKSYIRGIDTMNKRIRDFGIVIGNFPCGHLNSISDVEGINVGHVTLDHGPVKTGVTVIMPGSGNIFREKMLCGAHVINGFGKSTGLMQVDELGTLETPIALTNTLSVGDAYRGIVEYMLDKNPEIGDRTGTVNPLVFECNDGYLNDLRRLQVMPADIREAIAKASAGFEEGSVGAGTGMSAYGLKGGIGTSSRLIGAFGKSYTVGGLVLTNMGRLQDLTIRGKTASSELFETFGNGPPDKGSVIMILATDVPLSPRQLKRLSKRCIVGLSRTGSKISNGSGEISFAFSTANRIPHSPDELLNLTFLPDEELDPFFEAAGDIIEEAILNSMIVSKDTTGRNNHFRASLLRYMSGFNTSSL